ncbi:MAG: hypothetical protein JNK67_15270 [Alphaproteobacteria bacterium]|nr:hypothetical protein [Alphaproteobacteria bacterium]
MQPAPARMDGEIKRNVASLVGGIVIAAFVGTLAFLCLRELGVAGAAGALLAAAFGAIAGGYVRLADL